MKNNNVNEGFGKNLALGALGAGMLMHGCNQLSNQQSQEDLNVAAYHYAEQKVAEIEQNRELSPEEYNDAIDFYSNLYMNQKNESARKFKRLIKESVRKSIMDLIG